jgi:hypothetical protein
MAAAVSPRSFPLPEFPTTDSFRTRLEIADRLLEEMRNCTRAIAACASTIAADGRWRVPFGILDAWDRVLVARLLGVDGERDFRSVDDFGVTSHRAP